MDDTFQPDKLKLEVKHSAGFVGGTLVHTDKGLVPIEQLKVGDMVLSKHESGDGEVAYKRVLKTFKSPEKMPIVAVVVAGGSQSTFEHIFTTSNHPFWRMSDQDEVKNTGWILAEELEVGDVLVSSVDTLAYVNDVSPIYRLKLNGFSNLVVIINSKNRSVLYPSFTESDTVIVSFDKTPVFYVYENGGGVDYFDRDFLHSGSALQVNSELINKDFIEYCCREGAYEYLKDTGLDYFHESYIDYVYNIEVEVFHTYHVGHNGIWVHDVSCIE